MDRREEIILAALELASKNGLGNVSLSQIAQKVGIKKASLYNHFKSKDEIVAEMYKYLRREAKSNASISSMDFGMLVKGMKASDILKGAIKNYLRIVEDENLNMFYKVIYSERSINSEAAKIMLEETDLMILTTKQLFYAMQIHKVLSFKDVDMEAEAFAMTIHSMIDYYMDSITAGEKPNLDKIYKYIDYYCDINKIV